MLCASEVTVTHPRHYSQIVMFDCFRCKAMDKGSLAV